MRRVPISAAVVTLLATLASGADFSVTTTSDAGPGSLRQAIFDANASVGVDNVRFDIAGPGPHTIQPSSALPAIIDPIVIDGTTEPDFAGTPVIEIDGSAVAPPADGLTLDAHVGSTVRGLAINRFQEDAGSVGGRGILMSGGGGHAILGNFLGTDPSGTVDLGNDRFGVACIDCDGSTIGGTTPSDRNVLSGNDDAGVLIQRGDDNVVQGNYIGTDVFGTSALPGSIGVFVLTGSGGDTTDNRIGGTTPGAGNVIVANGRGVNIGNSTTTGTIVEGNLIGTDVTGTVALGNLTNGVDINSSPGNQIGGADPGAGNVIGGASASGVVIMNFGADGNVVQGNVIGSDASGAVPLPNGVGVSVRFSASGSPIGATIGGPGAGNRISNSVGAGVVVLSGFSSNPGMDTSPTGVRIQENVLVNNGALGIDLEDDGITPNDADDVDDGANGLQNAPVLISATVGGGSTTIDGNVDAMPNETFVLEFFVNATGDPSGAGEGETSLGSAMVMTDPFGDVAFSESVPGELTNGALVTATATDSAGNTSEFAVNVVVGAVPTTTSSSTSSTTVSSSSTITSTSTSSSMTTTSTTVPTSTSSTTSSSTVTTTSVTSTTLATTTTTTVPSSTSTTATTSSTSTSTVSSTSTSTTLPLATELLTGAKLRLTDNSAKPTKRRLQMVSTDRDGLTLGDAAAVEALLGADGSLRVTATAGDGFDTTYVLGAASWRLLSAKKPEKGIRYKDKDAPITAVVIKAGKRLLVKGKGEALGHTLGLEPATVEIELRIGDRRYCLEFGGQAKFKPEKKYLAKKAPAPLACGGVPSTSTTVSTSTTSSTTTSVPTTTSTSRSNTT